MTFNVIASDEAQREWDAAVNWYETQQPGVGLRFDNELRSFLHTLSERPERFRLATKLTRKARVPAPWPYSIYFTVNKAHREINIQAVWHDKRNPDTLRRRLK